MVQSYWIPSAHHRQPVRGKPVCLRRSEKSSRADMSKANTAERWPVALEDEETRFKNNRAKSVFASVFFFFFSVPFTLLLPSFVTKASLICLSLSPFVILLSNSLSLPPLYPFFHFSLIVTFFTHYLPNISLPFCPFLSLSFSLFFPDSLCLISLPLFIMTLFYEELKGP